jgi:hypothetical protein
VFQDTFSIGQLLGHETSGGNHGKTSVLEFLRLKSRKLFRIGWLEFKGVEVEVAGGVVGTQKAGLTNRDITRGHPSELGTVEFDLRNADGKDTPERGRNLSKVGDGGSLDRCVEEERRSFDRLADKESKHSQHTNTAMGELRLTITLKCVLVGLGSETKGVEETERGKGTRDGVDRERLCKANMNGILLAISF